MGPPASSGAAAQSSTSPRLGSTRSGSRVHRDEQDSADEGSSGHESNGGDKDNNEDASAEARGLKRKRYQTISSVYQALRTSNCPNAFVNNADYRRCELCKQRKVKCDRAQPTCGWCAKNGQVCEYKERKKPGLRAGYGKELESRLDRLEGIIQSQARLIETHLLGRTASDLRNDAPELSRQSRQSTSSLPSERGRSPRAAGYNQALSPSLINNSNNANLSARGITLVASPNDGRPMLHPRFQNGLNSPIAIPPSTQVQRQPQVEKPQGRYRFEGPSPLYTPPEQSAPDPDLPPYDLLYTLVDLYFEHINTWCPILHRRTTLDTFFGPSPLVEEDRMLLYAIVAATLRFSKDNRLDDKNRKRFHDNAKQKVLLYGLENSSVKALQALVILALDLVGSSNGPPGWKLLAVICRSVVQTGLSVEATSNLAANWYPSIYTLRANILPEPSTWVEDESRRRLFWEVYILDRYATITTAFDFALDEADIDRKLPCREEYFNKNRMVETQYFTPQARVDFSGVRENIGSWGFYVEIIGILSRIHLFLKRPVDIGSLKDVEEWQTTYKKLDNELTRWELSLHKDYAFDNASRLLLSKTNKTVNCGWAMLHATYQTAIIRLHSSAAYPTTRSAIFTPSYSAIQRCLLAVQTIHTLTTFVVENDMLDKVGPTFAFTLWVCARLLLVHGSTVAHTLNTEMYFFVETLRQMGAYWQVAERYSTILQRVLDEYNEYEQSADVMNLGEHRGTPATVKILADMRRCAFDLDFLIARQPRPANDAATGVSRTNEAAPSTRNGGLQDSEYLDLFGFFNYPRIPQYADAQSQLPQQQRPDAQRAQTSIDTSQGPSSANLMTTSSTTDNPQPIQNQQAVANQVNATAEDDTNDPIAGSLLGQEFNITNYLVPTPETDWLFSNNG